MDCPFDASFEDRTCTRGNPLDVDHDVFFVYVNSEWYVRPVALLSEFTNGFNGSTWEGIDDYTSVSNWILNEQLPFICDYLTCGTSQTQVGYFLQSGTPSDVTFFWPRHDGVIMSWDVPPPCWKDCGISGPIEGSLQYCTEDRGANAVTDMTNGFGDPIETVRSYYDFSNLWWTGSPESSYMKTITCSF